MNVKRHSLQFFKRSEPPVLPSNEDNGLTGNSPGISGVIWGFCNSQETVHVSCVWYKQSIEHVFVFSNPFLFQIKSPQFPLFCWFMYMNDVKLESIKYMNSV